jgi:hypothetical protein
MLALLGNVLYWAGWLVAVTLVVTSIFKFNSGHIRPLELLVLIGLAVIVWMIGRACRYVLAGR